MLAAFDTFLPGYDVVTAQTGPMRSRLKRPGREVDGIVIAGETLFARPSDGAPGLMSELAASLVPAVAGKPLALLGVSAGGMTTASERWAARWLVRHADLFLLGDSESAAALASAGAPAPMRVAADPAWAAMEDAPTGPGSGDVVVAVLDGSAGLRVENALALGLTAVANRGMRVRLQPWSDEDSGSASRVYRHLEAAGHGTATDLRAAPSDMVSACEALAEGCVVVALRYRALHAAAMVGVPVVAVDLEPRIGALARRLAQRTVAPERLSSSLAGIIRVAADSPAPSPAAIKEEVSRAESAFALLRLVMERGDVDTGQLDGLPLAPEPWL